MQSSEHAREEERLSALERYDVLDTPQEEAFDRIIRLTRRFFDVPMATINLIDGHRAWSKAGQRSACDVPKRFAFCNVAIGQTQPLVLADTLADPRFRDNPFVAGEPHIRFYAGAPLCTPEGLNIGTLCALDTRPRVFGAEDIEVLSDLARVVMSELELRTLATTDGLTGALSRRAFREEGARALALAVRHRYNVSCIVFDLDHFKTINDAHGHAAGDRVLSESTALCREQLRRSDLLGRLGGEEFAILLPHTARAAATEVAEKLRAAFAGRCVAGPSAPIRFTASFGVAALDRFVPDIETLLHHADTALYAAKTGGRNQCKEWRPIETIPGGLRRRVFKAGQIAFNGGRSAIDCTVRSLSDTSADLDVISTADIPEMFKLRIESDDLSRACRVVARRDKQMAVDFV